MSDDSMSDKRGKEAVAEYSKVRSKDLIPTAKKHLAAVGWRIYYQKKGYGRELRYQSPDGRIFPSLVSACRWHELCVQNSEIRPNAAKKDDDICSVCHDDEGDLLVCAKCPSAFHTRCLGLQVVPQESWFCPSCTCRICNLEGDCLHKCAQCAHLYHTACLRRRGVIQDPKGNGIWFCSLKCEQIHLGLQNLLGKPVPVVGQDNLQWTLYKHNGSDDDEFISKLNRAVSIIHECFEPVEEPYNGRDTVEDAVFNKSSDLPRLNFQGFYTLALERNELVTVALIRIYGERVAEMPLVATGFDYRRLGMCRILMNQLEKTLVELGIERLVLPAAKSVVNTWQNNFGFSKVNESERLNFLGCTFLDFYGTILCQKRLNNIHTQEEHIDGNTISEATRQHIQKLLAETSNYKRKATDVFKYHKRRKLASNDSHCVSVF